MHVLVLPSWYRTADAPWHGAFFENQALALAQVGVRVGIAFVERRSLRSLAPGKLGESHFQVVCSADHGVTTVRMKGWNTLGQTVGGAKVWCALSERLVRAYVDRFGVPDVLHAHAALWAGRVAVRMGHTLSRPSVVTEHSSQILLGSLGRAERREVERVYQEADTVLAVSQKLLEAVRSIAGTGFGLVVPNTVDFRFFNLPTTPRQREPFTFLSVCNLVAEKGVDRLIKAFANVSRVCLSVRLVIVGSGVEAEALQRLAHECGIAAKVEFTGGLARDRVRQQMWNANALILSSAFETFGVVLVEALATGIPVIATRCGGPEEIVEAGLGLLVDPDSEDALAEAMVSMTGHFYQEHTLRERVRCRFSFEEVGKALLGVYDTLETRSTVGRRVTPSHQ